MVGVSEHDAGPRRAQIAGCETLDGTLGPYWHEGRRRDDAVRGREQAGTSLAFAGGDLYRNRRPYCDLPPPTRSIASPKE
jgi:hypothetical protein